MSLSMSLRSNASVAAPPPPPDGAHGFFASPTKAPDGRLGDSAFQTPPKPKPPAAPPKRGSMLGALTVVAPPETPEPEKPALSAETLAVVTGPAPAPLASSGTWRSQSGSA